MPLQARVSPSARTAKSKKVVEPDDQVVQVVLPDGDVEVRLASLDLTAGHLILSQVSFEDDEVVIGGSATVKLASIGAASVQACSVKLHAGGRSGKVLIEMRFESNAEAKPWADAINEVAESLSAPASPAPGRSMGLEGDATSMLRTLVAQQEEQARLLEAICQRKGEQLTQMQEHLEGALGKLQLGQQLYGEQQKVMDSQKETIITLQKHLQGKAANSAEAACANNASAATAGAAAAARAGARGPVAQMSAAFEGRTSPSGSRPSPTAGRLSPPGGAPGMTRAPPPSSDVEEEEEDEDDEEEEEDDAEGMEEERALLEKLRLLEAEKFQCEAQLRQEQGDIASQLKDLQSMMASLGLQSRA
mmetsp:Transcript_50303/g.90394  ORF Transcript_50303/g.90394 Transcript_50303/m.90394 type:complete len:362 (-) Transcript_50303:86-1171(-)